MRSHTEMPDVVSEAIVRVAPHMRPICDAVREQGCAMAFVQQNAGPFAFVRGKPLILFLFDDTDGSLGPGGFDRASLDTYVRRCGAAVVITSGALPSVYALAASNAVLLRQDVIVVETRLQHEFAWIEAIRAARPEIAMLLSTVAGGHA